MFVKAPIKSRPSGQLVHVPGEEMGRQIRHQGTKPVTQFESGPTPCRGPNQYVCHTDAGSQYVSFRYARRLIEAGIEASVGSKGDSYDCELNGSCHLVGV